MFVITMQSALTLYSLIPITLPHAWIQSTTTGTYFAREFKREAALVYVSAKLMFLMIVVRYL